MTQFLTARAARRMIEHGSGVILTIAATPARVASPFVGGMAAAWAAMEAFSRTPAAELGPRSIRVVTLRSHGMPETATVREVLDIHARDTGMSREQIQPSGRDKRCWAGCPRLRRWRTRQPSRHPTGSER